MSTPESKPADPARRPRQPSAPNGRVGQDVESSTSGWASPRAAARSVDKIFPDHWSFMLGEIAMYSFRRADRDRYLLVALLRPPHRQQSSTTPGSNGYQPLNGYHMSEAYQSTVNLSFSVRAGLLMLPDASLGRPMCSSAPS